MLLALGCGERGGVQRYEWTGDVTYKGSPVPSGRISFIPDTSQNNDGPAGMADIRNGEYEMRPGKGIVGGPHVVTVYGEDGTMATETRNNALFEPYEMAVDFADENGVMNFDIPAE